MSGWSLDYDDDIAIAAEYVLGLLPPDEQARVEERLAVDPAFRDLVARWAEGFVALTDDIPEVAPPPSVEAGLRRRLFGEEAPRRGWGLFWPALLGGILAAGLALWVLVPGIFGLGEPDYAARIAAANGSLIVEARFDADTGRLRVERVTGEVPQGHDLELWLVHVADNTTTSLGVLPHAETGVMEVRTDLAPEFKGNALALSVEPPGGSPTGQATGPIVAVGPITAL